MGKGVTLDLGQELAGKVVIQSPWERHAFQNRMDKEFESLLVKMAFDFSIPDFRQRYASHVTAVGKHALEMKDLPAAQWQIYASQLAKLSFKEQVLLLRCERPHQFHLQ